MVYLIFTTGRIKFRSFLKAFRDRKREHSEKITRVLFVALPLLFFHSCATLFGPERYPLYVETDPPGALVTVFRGTTGEVDKEAFSPETRTPATLRVNPENPILVRFELKGYRTTTKRVNRTMDSAASGLFFAPIDLLTGAFYALDEGALLVTMEELDPRPDTPLQKYKKK